MKKQSEGPKKLTLKSNGPTKNRSDIYDAKHSNSKESITSKCFGCSLSCVPIELPPLTAASPQGVTSVPSSKPGSKEEGKQSLRVLSFFDKMKNVNVKNLASSIVSSVQSKVSKIDEVIGDPLLKAAGIKEKNSSKTRRERRYKSEGKKSSSGRSKKSPITWSINKEVYELIETKRKKQMKRCLKIQSFQFDHLYVQHKNSLVRLNTNSASADKTDSSQANNAELKLFNNQLDQLTDYELMEVFKKMCLQDKFKFRRVSKRFRNCVNQIIQYETAFALIERKATINFRLDQITSYSVDPIYMNHDELSASLVQNINRYMTKLQSIAIAFPIDFELFLSLIRRRNLTNLVLSGATFVNKHMNALPDYTVSLTSLSLDQCEINDKGLEVIVRECGKVLNLRLSHCNHITGVFLEHLPPNFVCLELASCKAFQLDSWRFLLDKERKQMTTFSIEYIKFHGQLIEKMTKFDKLTTLRLTFNESLDYKFRSIAMYTRLETLKVADHSDPPCFTDNVFLEIQRGCDRLTKLELAASASRAYLTDASFANLAEDCVKIASIRLISLTNLTGKTLIALSKLKYLLELSLDNMTFEDAVLVRTLPDFRSLQKIKLYRCPNITNHLPEQLFKVLFTRPVWYYLALRSNPNIELAKINQTDKPPNVIFECS